MLATLLAWLFTGCASCPHVTGVRPFPCPSGIVFVADGAGDFRGASKALNKAVRDGACPLRVETFVWSHGYLRMLSDQLGREYAEEQGRRLAAEIVRFHEACPDSPIYLVGHCAGCRVVLAAASSAPEGIVDRVILLAPSVEAKYDLRAALRNTRTEIDACCSREDTFYLGVIMLAISSMQPGGYPVAGFSGFVPQVETPEDAVLYTKLREYPWTPSLACTGHYGGHYGCFQPGYLRHTVLPLLGAREAPGASVPTN